MLKFGVKLCRMFENLFVYFELLIVFIILFKSILERERSLCLERPQFDAIAKKSPISEVHETVRNHWAGLLQPLFLCFSL